VALPTNGRHPTALPAQQHKRPIHLLRVVTGPAGFFVPLFSSGRLIDPIAVFSEKAEALPRLTHCGTSRSPVGTELNVTIRAVYSPALSRLVARLVPWF